MTASYAYSRPARVSAASRERVFASAKDLGYTGPDPAARSLRRGIAGALGVVLGEHLTYAFEDPQAVAFLAGVAEVCAEAGDGMMILPVANSTEDVPRLSAAAVDGFIFGRPWTTLRSSMRRSQREDPSSSTAGLRPTEPCLSASTIAQLPAPSVERCSHAPHTQQC